MTDNVVNSNRVFIIDRFHLHRVPDSMTARNHYCSFCGKAMYHFQAPREGRSYANCGDCGVSEQCNSPGQWIASRGR